AGCMSMEPCCWPWLVCSMCSPSRPPSTCARTCADDAPDLHPSARGSSCHRHGNARRSHTAAASLRRRSCVLHLLADGRRRELAHVPDPPLTRRPCGRPSVDHDILLLPLIVRSIRVELHGHLGHLLCDVGLLLAVLLDQAIILGVRE